MDSWQQIKEFVVDAYKRQQRYELDSKCNTQIIPFSLQSGNDSAAAFVRDVLPDVMYSIIPQYLRNWDFLRTHLSTDLEFYCQSENAALAQMNGRLPARLENQVENIALGCYYDVYKAGNYVIKIERYSGMLHFPSTSRRAYLWRNLDASLTPQQKDIYMQVRQLKNAEIALFRSISTQSFYVDTLAKQLPLGAFAATEFALLRIGDYLFDLQVQPYFRGFSLLNMLEEPGFWRKLFWDAPSLKPSFSRYERAIQQGLGNFLQLNNIDHHPSNFIFEDRISALVLVDIQEMMDAHAASGNLQRLQRMWLSWKDK